MTRLIYRPSVLAATLVAATLVGLAPWALHAWTSFRPTSLGANYEVQPISRGDILLSISASGTLNPVNVVSVGTQISGQISQILINFNDKVKRGDLLAVVDPSVYLAAVEQSRANLASARAALNLAIQSERRSQALAERNLLAKEDLDKVTANRISAQAQLDVSKAQLSRDTSNLDHTRIYAPISGVVLSREVSVGQTVAASFQTPTLFKIAEDLSKMQIECHVSEADIGLLKIGQRSAFTVDAFPNVEFSGRLRQVRLNPVTDQGIVVYVVVIDVDNSGGRLMPGMTAQTHIVIDQRRNVVRVPASALTFEPNTETPLSGSKLHDQYIYVLNGGSVRKLPVKIGLSDGEYVELSGGQARAGMSVVLENKSGPPDSATVP